MKFQWYKLITILLFSLTTIAQENFPVNGVHESSNIATAFIDADVHISYEKQIKNCTLLIQKDIILDLGFNLELTPNTKIINAKGFKICPSFIDIYSNYDQAQPDEDNLSNWNSAIKAEYDVINNFRIDKKKSEKLIENGFGSINIFNDDGIIRGTSSLLNLSYNKPHKQVLTSKSALFLSFNKGSSKTTYPRSLMGAIALIRQTLYDLEWYQNQTKTYDSSLEALGKKIKLPMIFEVDDFQSIFRANKIAKEFDLSFIFKTNGDEYQRLIELNKLKPSLIVPLNFPKIKLDSDYYKNLNYSLAELKHVDTAPHNIKKLSENNIEYAITPHGTKNFNEFYKNIELVISTGVSETEILKSLTYTPAKFLNANDKIGSIEKNKKANFIIYKGKLFHDDFTIFQNWINGEQYIINDIEAPNLIGRYKFNFGNKLDSVVEISLNKGKFTAEFINDSSKVKKIEKFRFANNSISFKVNKYLFSGVKKDSLIFGESFDSLGNVKPWVLSKISSDLPIVKTTNKKTEISHSEITYPNSAYGLSKYPVQESIIFRNATLWTNEKLGIVDNYDIAIADGKIISIGKNISKKIFKKSNNIKIIDAEGKHITSGIIDEHSHIAIKKGVNEGSQSVTSEVRIGDVINCKDINIYRQLAGGVTIAQLLHGSANPIGGQSAIIKLRWGQLGENLKYKKAKPFIKFALGENVKQSNWGSNYRTRFPQTRMGVEQTFENAFTRALDYDKKLQLHKKNKKNPKPRRDLELDALVEVLNKERYVTCHSYVQSEILMLMDIAEKFEFNINIFTHILEGYKVAEELKNHGASASTFSDWWAYKYEVNDAIPYNAALLNIAGVNTAINSDDAEMGRRLNHEAAKMVKYGNASHEDAWKSITLNPAKMLEIDEFVGSLKAGKEADIVLWSGNPLSVYSKVERTYVDGRCYFSQEEDQKQREIIKSERARLISKLNIKEND